MAAAWGAGCASEGTKRPCPSIWQIVLKYPAQTEKTQPHSGKHLDSFKGFLFFLSHTHIHYKKSCVVFLRAQPTNYNFKSSVELTRVIFCLLCRKTAGVAAAALRFFEKSAVLIP